MRVFRPITTTRRALWHSCRGCTAAASAEPPQVHHIAITGGPCGGKTTALTKLQETLSFCGFDTYVVPEFATLFFHGGNGFPVHGTAQHRRTWEAGKMQAQMSCEDAFVSIAQASGKPTVVISDRGIIDSKAFMDEEEWQSLVTEHGWHTEALRTRYDAVVHIVTAADGAEEFYTTSNNEARRETAEEARQQDKAIQQAWLGHQHMFVVDNDVENFKQKVREVERYVLQHLGQPTPDVTKKELQVYLDKASLQGWLSMKGNTCADFTIRTTFLPLTDGRDVALRMLKPRGADESQQIYMKISRRGLPGGQHMSTQRRISKREYEGDVTLSSPDAPPISMRRRCFVHGGASYKLDTLQQNDGTEIHLLSRMAVREASGGVATHSLPPFATAIEDVSGRSLRDRSNTFTFK